MKTYQEILKAKLKTGCSATLAESEALREFSCQPVEVQVSTVEQPKKRVLVEKVKEWLRKSN